MKKLVNVGLLILLNVLSELPSQCSFARDRMRSSYPVRAIPKNLGTKATKIVSRLIAIDKNDCKLTGLQYCSV